MNVTIEVFGPVQSRRFGLSLGINHLPPKLCSYACVYCQLGRTNPLSIQPKAYGSPQQVLRAVSARLAELPGPPDYLTFVPNGEPTLDSNLGKSIEVLKPLGIPIAVICNASLLGDEQVRANLMQTDTVSLKVDAVNEKNWRKVNRPHGRLRIQQVLEGMRLFAQDYQGRLLTETMLVRGLNDSPAILEETAAFVACLHAHTAYPALPLRAPAEEWVIPPSKETLQNAQQIFNAAIPDVKLMVDLPQSDLAASADPLRALLETLKVHPLRKNEILSYLERNHLPPEKLAELVGQKRLRVAQYEGSTFYVANYPESE